MLAVFVAFAAATGFLRVAHDLTSHICSCVSGLVLVEACEQSHHHGCHEPEAADEPDPGHTHNHKHPPGEDDCDLCAVLHAVRHAVADGDAPAVVTPRAVIAGVVTHAQPVRTEPIARPWSARGPPITI